MMEARLFATTCCNPELWEQTIIFGVLETITAINRFNTLILLVYLQQERCFFFGSKTSWFELYRPHKTSECLTQPEKGVLALFPPPLPALPWNGSRLVIGQLLTASAS